MRSSSPWQVLYGSLHRLRWRWYRHHAKRLPRPVLSVGNIHWGGTGKTPLVASLAASLRDRGQNVAILSRGYGRRSRGPLVVSRGRGLEVPVHQAGDEPSWLAESLPQVAVVVGESRYRAGLLALEELEPEVFLLDDGFSHLALERDVNLVLLPADDPLGGGLLPPGGRLREPLEALTRADAVLLSVEQDARDQNGSLLEELSTTGFGGPLFQVRRRTGTPAWPDSSPRHSSTRMLLVSGVGRPQGVAASARASGLEIVDHLVFPDHHPYPRKSLEKIENRARYVEAEALLTTGKDRVKLQGRTALPVVELPLVAEPEAAFWNWLYPILDQRSP